MSETLNPPNRPRRGVLGAVAASATAALVAGVIVLGGDTPVEASGLERFASCAELSEWGATASSRQYAEFDTVAGDLAGDGVPAPASTVASAAGEGPLTDVDAGVDDAEGASRTEEATSQAPEGDGTNVVVQGIDEPDLVERLGGDRALVVGGQTLAVVDLGAATVVARATVPWGAQVTYDADAGVAWAVGTSDTGQTRVQRFVVAEAALTDDGTWSADGQLVSARRQGGELLVVATDWFDQPQVLEDDVVAREQAEDLPTPDGSEADPGGGADGSTGADEPVALDTLPFAGDPVPCDQVLHPLGPAEPSATLLAVLPVNGPLEPLRSTEVVGSGSLVHVTADAAFLATPSWDAGTGAPLTGLHRFDLASLTHTGSGQVRGSLLNDFSMSEHDGFLRVAVTDGGGFVGIPMAVEGDGGIGDGGTVDGGVVVEEPLAPDSPTAVPETVAPAPEAGTGETTDEATDPDAPVGSEGLVGPATGAVGSVARVVATTLPEPAVPDTAVPEPPTEPETTVPETTVPETTVPETTVPETTEPGDTVPETVPETLVPGPTVVEPEPRPGPGDPLNSIVVFDTEGPLDVVGSTPRFGLPGETLFGIRFDGTTAYAVTFLQTDPFYVIDLADPTAPRVVGELKLPGFSAYLHPVSATEVVGFGPDESGRASAKLFNVSDPAAPVLVDSIVLGDESPVTYDHHAFVSLGGGRFAVPATNWVGTTSGPTADVICGVAGCDDVGSYEVRSDVVVLAMAGGRLVEEQRFSVSAPEPVARIIPADRGWGLVTSTEVLVLDAGGDERATLAIA
jgi:hypothetical protein